MRELTWRSSFMPAVLALGVWSAWCGAADDERSSDAPEPVLVLSSERVVLKDTVYKLEAEGSRLFLVSRPLEGTERRVKREPLETSVGRRGRIADISLAVMGSKNLMAAVKVRRDDEFDFHCLTFTGPWSTQPPETPFKTYEAKFHSTSRNLKILAISGKHVSSTALIVLGDLPRPGVPSQGIIYFSVCPWPPSDGVLLPFEGTAATDRFE